MDLRGDPTHFMPGYDGDCSTCVQIHPRPWRRAQSVHFAVVLTPRLVTGWAGGRIALARPWLRPSSRFCSGRLDGSAPATAAIGGGETPVPVAWPSRRRVSGRAARA